MTTANELRDVYLSKTKVEAVKFKGQNEAIIIERTVNRITNMLKNKAKNGQRDVRLTTKSVNPNVAVIFRERGFIVWENSEITFIQIPL